MEHSKTPWKLAYRGMDGAYDIDAHDEKGNEYSLALNVNENNARRIEACVNALAPFTTEQIDQGIDLVALVKQIEKLTDDYRAQGLALQAAKSMQAGETERADKAEALRDRLAEALEWMLAEYAAMSILQKPNGAFVRAADQARAALAAVKGE